jgi:flagellar operon protein
MKADNLLNPNVGRVGPQTDTSVGIGGKPVKGEFEEALKSLRESVKPLQNKGPSGVLGPNTLKFSNHAIERMRARGLAFSPEQLTRIEQGVQKAAAKGAQNTLLMSDGAALIVSVKNNTVVTVMDPNQMKDSVVTNIDSTVLV